MTEVHVELAGVTKVFPAKGNRPEVRAVNAVDFELRRGEFVAIVGPSGCGKTTLLDILAGLQTPSEGDVRLDGRSVTGTVPDGVGVVFQEDASFPWLSVWDNIAFGLRREGVDKATVKERVEAILRLTGLKEFANAYPAQLSGGMRQRVCIARTLIMQPDLILLDEPFGALDQQTRLLMGDELLRLWRETGATVVIITHSIDEAVMLADRVATMSSRPGRFIEVIETGWPRERDSSIVSSEEFGRLNGRVWSLLREESMKAVRA